MRRQEELIQARFCTWLKTTYPGVIFRSDGGGLRLSRGLAYKFAKLQHGRAYPDVFIAAPRDKYHGCFIEIKAERKYLLKKDGKIRKSKHIQEQEAVLSKLMDLGYYAVFAIGLKGCQNVAEWYLTQTSPRD